MHTFPLADYMTLIDDDNWQAVANLMSASAAKVALAGADFIICPDNTIMEGSVYHTAIERHHITHAIPISTERAMIHRIIF